MVDADRNVMVMNRRVINLLGLPEDYFGKRVKLDDVLSYLWAEGEFGFEGDTLAPKMRDLILTGGMSAGIDSYERSRPNGITLEIHTTPLPDGGGVSSRRNQYCLSEYSRAALPGFDRGRRRTA